MLELRRHGKVLVLAALLVPRTTHADRWVVVEAPAAAAVSDVQAHVFNAGAMPAVGAYISNDAWGLGFRARFGVLRDGAAPEAEGVMDPGTGGLASGTIAVRFGTHSGWAELAGGVAVTGEDVVPAVEAGVGWLFSTRHFDVGPSVRYMKLVDPSSDAQLGSADLVLVGVDLRFGKDRPRRLPRVAAAPVAVPPPPPPAEIERDAAAIVDVEPTCAAESDGCAVHVSPDLPLMIDDRITLNDDVLFDLNRARVKRSGRRIVDAIAAAWRLHPDWITVTIEGHADVRGTDEWNLELSQLRADRVRDLLVEQGFAADKIQAIGYGRSRPRAPGRDEASHQRNRRVEFVIDREREIVQ